VQARVERSPVQGLQAGVEFVRLPPGERRDAPDSEFREVRSVAGPTFSKRRRPSGSLSPRAAFDRFATCGMSRPCASRLRRQGLAARSSAAGGCRLPRQRQPCRRLRLPPERRRNALRARALRSAAGRPRLSGQGLQRRRLRERPQPLKGGAC
jgi:hypothetical protein